jgi:glycosyltransferase involved in cell wall biosynthesis
MNILFLTIGEIIDINERGIYTDLIRKFRDEGHHVYVVSPRERKRKENSTYIEQSGVHVLGVKTLNLQKTNLFEKGLATLLIERQFKNAIKRNLKDVTFDLILYSTPPVTFTNVIRFVKRRDGAVSYLLLKDIFPQNAVDMKLISKWNPIYYWFRRKEKALYRTSDYIGCMSPANVAFVLKQNPFVPKECIEVNPNSIERIESEIKPCKKSIRERYNLPVETPVFIYGGNLGKPQGVDFLLKVLSENRDRNDCYFLIIGSGTEFKKIQLWFERNKPSNAQLIKGLPKKEYDALVGCCDVGLIFLDSRFTIPNYPSRLLSYMENKLPIIAATDVNTDIGRIAEAEGYGFWCESVHVSDFNRCLNSLLDKAVIERMGMLGFKYLQDNYQVSSSYKIIMNHFKVHPENFKSFTEET